VDKIKDNKKKILANLHQRRRGNLAMWVAKERNQRQWFPRNNFVFKSLMKKKAIV
jgi:hypothetical protein